MADLYRSALRSCYYKSHLAGNAPNPNDPLRTEFHQLRQRADLRFLATIILGLPIIYQVYYKLIAPQFPTQILKRSLILSSISVTYLLGAAFLGYDESSDEKLTQLAWKYESDLIRICPDVTKFAPGKTGQSDN